MNTNGRKHAAARRAGVVGPEWSFGPHRIRPDQAERNRRFRGDAAPHQRGAIDAAGSVGSPSGETVSEGARLVIRSFPPADLEFAAVVRDAVNTGGGNDKRARARAREAIRRVYPRAKLRIQSALGTKAGEAAVLYAFRDGQVAAGEGHDAA